MQEAIILQYRGSLLECLNKKLRDGWKVISTCAMPSCLTDPSERGFEPTCLVIIEKD